MAGRGPAPKPVGRRVRRNSEPAPVAALRLVRVAAPDLPDSQDWHPQTRDWWAMWATSELAKDFTSTDWSFLLDTALMHHTMWDKGHWTLAAEVRLRVAKFGATPEDRARLRIVFADADEKDEKRSGRSSRERFTGLSAVGD